MDSKGYVTWMLVGGLAGAQIFSEHLAREEKHIEDEQKSETPALVGTASAISYTTTTSTSSIIWHNSLKKP